jgi:hypothetical protein
MIKKIIAYIFRSWDKEESYTHPGLKILLLPYRFIYYLPDRSLFLELNLIYCLLSNKNKHKNIFISNKTLYL